MKFSFGSLLILLGLIFVASSCKTDDILPNAEFTVSSNDLSENNGTLILSAHLNGVSKETIRIQLAFSGTAILNQDYSTSSTELIIEAGDSLGSITLTGIDDGIIEGTETIEISIASKDGVIVLNDAPLILAILDGDVDSDGDGVPDSDDDCPDLFGVSENNGCPFVGFIINEVLYDPADELAGDANGDGTRDPLQDEFIEFFNSTAENLDISGYTISDASQTRHTFPAGTIVPSNGVIVVFGGGTPTGDFGGAIVQIASEGQLNMNNAGDFVTIRNSNDAVIQTFDIGTLSGNPNESYTRSPDVFGAFERHSTLPEANGGIHSPGTKINGAPF